MNIKEIREKLCLTQTEFAKLLGVSMQSISNWECGKAKISIKCKRKILLLCKGKQLNKSEKS